MISTTTRNGRTGPTSPRVRAPRRTKLQTDERRTARSGNETPRHGAESHGTREGGADPPGRRRFQGKWLEARPGGRGGRGPAGHRPEARLDLPPGFGGAGGPDGWRPIGRGAGGDMFGSDLYYISFLGQPSTSNPWMLQFGGHHLALNITIAGEQRRAYADADRCAAGRVPSNGKNHPPARGGRATRRSR